VFKLFYTTPINVQHNMPIKIGFFSWERIIHFPFISYGKNLFGIRPVWYKSKDLERIKDVHRGTTVSCRAVTIVSSGTDKAHTAI
jgi:hypothetical protein